jgi:L-lactate dehydrogenase complex protein LldF
MSDSRQAFKQRVRQAIGSPSLQVALDNNARRHRVGRPQVFASLPEDGEGLRAQAHSIRQHTIQNLDHYLAQFVQKLESNGITVHRAADAQEAQRLVIQIARGHNATLVAKAKSMVSEEIHLNHALEECGMRVVETDLGEFIMQLRAEPPSHIIVPAIHLSRQDVAETFEQELEIPYTTDVKALTKAARRELRRVFLKAQVGISGVNFGVAESGTLCLVTNEGNGRMVTTVPPVHIALMGMERLVPTLDDLALMLQLLPRSATGQKLTSYVSLIQTPQRAADPDGAQERHLILLDNGRAHLAETELAEALLCIRCGACLNVCPVFRELGGHAYASVYPGPIGSLVSPGLFGVSEFGHLAKASTLCGACADVCPVKIDFPTLLLRVRDQYTQTVQQPRSMRWGMPLYSWVVERPWLYGLGQKAAALGGRLLPRRGNWLRWLPAPALAWTQSRDFPPFAARPFRERFKKISNQQPPVHKGQVFPNAANPSSKAVELPAANDQPDLAARFEQELGTLGGELIRCTAEQACDRIITRLRELGVRTILSWEKVGTTREASLERLRDEGFTILDPDLVSNGADRQERLALLGKAEAGLTGALAALADTGTLVVASGPGRSQLASLLPPIHLAVLWARDLYPTMADWLERGGSQMVRETSNIAFISGPSRTADIEMTLTIGVHGPEQVIVVLIEE